MFTNRVKELRLNNKFTQQYVADYLSVKRPTYTRYEIGTNQPDNETIVKLARLFNVSTDYLLGKEENEPKKIRPSEDERILKLLQENGEVGKLVEKISQLSPQNQQHLLRLVMLEADHINNQSEK